MSIVLDNIRIYIHGPSCTYPVTLISNRSISNFGYSPSLVFAGDQQDDSGEQQDDPRPEEAAHNAARYDPVLLVPDVRIHDQPLVVHVGIHGDRADGRGPRLGCGDSPWLVFPSTL